LKLDCKMQLDTYDGTLELAGITLGTATTREMLIKGSRLWEGWPEKSDGRTTSYRTIISTKKEKAGDIYIIADFSGAFITDAVLCSWRFAPEKLMMGIQKKVEGAITKNLRTWFYEKTHIQLPVSGSWGHIDAAYDPHNLTGTIVCNYRSAFHTEDEWRKYCKRNNIIY